MLKKLYYKSQKIFVSIVLNLIVCSIPVLAQAQGSNFQLKVPDNGVPGRRENGGSTRGPDNKPNTCISASAKPKLLTLLLPRTNLGLTASAYPRFFWYTPKNSADRVQFSLFKAGKVKGQKTLIYSTSFNVSGEGGITSLSLPSGTTMPPLEINQTYQWSVSLICNPSDNFPNPVITVEGSMRRVPLSRDFSKKLQMSSPKEKIYLYGEQGLWFDLLSTLALLRACNVNDPLSLSIWTSVMNHQKVNLQPLSTQPIHQTCNDFGF